MPVKTIFEFVDEQPGGMDSALEIGQLLYLFPSGARLQLLEPNDLRYGSVYAAPTDPEQLLEVQRQYWQAKLNQAEADFKEYKRVLTEKEGRFRFNTKLYGPVPGKPGIAWLTRIKEVVKQLRNAVADIDRKYNALPAVRLRRERTAKLAKEIAEIDLAIAEQEHAERDAVASISLDD